MKPQFVTKAKGKNVAVLIPLKDYNKILDELDELIVRTGDCHPVDPLVIPGDNQRSAAALLRCYVR